MLDPWKLTMLIQLDALGTMRAVADTMHLSTSTISQQLATLETEAGIQLMERSGRRISLTPQGKALVSAAVPAVESLNGLDDLLAGERDEPKGTIRVAAFSSALSAIALPAVAALQSQHGLIRVELFEQEPNESLPLLDTGQRDIVIAANFGSASHAQLGNRRTIELTQDPLYAVLPVANPLSTRRSLPIHALSNQRWALEQDSTYLNHFVREFCQSAGFSPDVVATLASQPAMLDAVEHGLCVTVLPALALQPHSMRRRNLRRVRLAPVIRRNVIATTTVRHEQRYGVGLLLDALRHQAGNLR